MLKEIVDIGKVSNKLGSVFTFKDLPKFYVEITLKWDGKDFTFIPNETIQYTNDIEKYLECGVHRGKKGNMLYLLPSSFIFENRASLIEQILNFLVTETKYSIIFSTLHSLMYDTFENNKIKRKKQDKETRKKVYNQILDLMLDSQIIFYPRITKYFTVLLKNIEAIEKLSSMVSKKIKDTEKENLSISKINQLSKKIPIIIAIKHQNFQSYFYEKKLFYKVFENIEFNNTSGKFVKPKQGICNITQKEDFLYYPSGSFYYPFSTDKVNVKYNLIDDKNLFVLSKEAYIDFMTGTTFLESYNRFYFMGLNSYITATCLNEITLKEFQKYAQEAQGNFDGLFDVVSEFFEYENELLLNFYFNEPTKTGNNVVEYIKDVIPSTLIQNVEVFKALKEFYAQEFNRKLDKYSWQQHIYHIFYKKNEQDSYKKMRTALFRKIALNDVIDRTQLMLFMNEKMQYGISKSDDNKQKYYYGDVLKHYIFLHWVTKINKGESAMGEGEKKEMFVGKSYEEKLTYFLQNGNLVKDSSSMKMGACVGLAIKILSWSINNYDKKSLAFVGKRIERNNLTSVQTFMNEIFAKTKFHEFESLQSINIKLSTQEMLHINDNTFNKDEFIFGLFLGNELYNNVKSDKDPIQPKDEDETTENDTTTTTAVL
ncbi:MAG: hypothetical protein EOL93_03365 [Epsilonproteobacteria bacterium]|nr:hypothetical protein [Campylobacterota bacterium]